MRELQIYQAAQVQVIFEYLLIAVVVLSLLSELFRSAKGALFG